MMSFCSRKVGVLTFKSNRAGHELILLHIGIACKTLWSLSDPETENGLSHNFLTLQNGLQMHYISPAISSQSTDSLIIFLHGFPDSCCIWEQQLRSGLAGKAKLVALDLPGCGGSDSHFRYGPDEILNAVAEAIVQLKNRYLSTSSSPTSRQKSILVSHDW
jgi:pimeloyl-ACP methyl ester carboxylesterase